MSRKGECIYKRSDGRYEARYIRGYNDEGRAIYGSVYATTYNECKRKRTKVLLNMESLNKKVVKGRKTKNLNDLLDIWLFKKKSRIKESSYTRYYNLVNQHIRNNKIGKVKVYKLSTEMVNDYLIGLLRNGRLDGKGGLSKNSVYDISNIFRQIIKDNNLDIKLMKISNEFGKGKSLCGDEKNNLENYLKNSRSFISIGILFSLFLGLRESEVCGLTWENIDLEKKLIHVKNIVTRVKSFDDTKNKTKLIITTPKTKTSIRVLPIPNKIHEILLSVSEKVHSNYYLLTNSTRYMDPRTFYNHYKKVLASLNITDYTLHDLRHTFATSCIELGIDPKTLMELLGHSNVTTTLNIYVHSSIDAKRSIVDQL